MSSTMTAEMEVLKSRLKATWMAGNYDYFSRQSGDPERTIVPSEYLEIVATRA